MANTLYWKRPPREDTFNNSLNLSTWYLLADLCKVENKEDLRGYVLSRDDLDKLETVILVAKHQNNKELEKEIKKLIDGIYKYDSIELFISG